MGTPNSRDKYGTLLEIFSKKKWRRLTGRSSRGSHQVDQEYFDTIIMQMNNAVQPGLGETMSDDGRTAFENAILAIAAKLLRKPSNSTRSTLLVLVNAQDMLTA